MKYLLSRILGHTSDLTTVQPLLALFLSGAMLAVFLSVTLPRRAKSSDAATPPGLLWTLYSRLGTLIWASMLVMFLVIGFSYLRSYLHQTVAHFQQHHGRITEAN